jgi:N-acetylglucosaminyl-diphospho-decaprenol L-rhamnosyltransferase
VTAVVISHNTRACLEKCLSRLSELGLHVVVVDTASSDGSADLARGHFPQFEVLAQRENRGFGTAANAGISRSATPYVLLLNADAWPEDGSVSELVALADEERRLAVIAPSLLNPDESPQRSVFGYPTRPLALALWSAVPQASSLAFQGWRWLTGFLARSPERLGEAYWLVQGTDFPAGAALLLRKDAFDEVRGFDERFFMYSEETDLCRRVRDAGWQVAYCPRAQFVHVGGASAGQRRDEMYREQLRSYLRFIAKHSGPHAADRARRLTAASLRVRAAVPGTSSRRRYNDAATWLAGNRIASLL